MSLSLRKSTTGETIEQQDDGSLALAALLGLISSILVAGVTAFFIYLFYHPSIDLSEVSSIFLPELIWFAPEPVEKLQYLVVIFSFPIVLFASTVLIYRWLRKRTTNVNKHKVYDASLGVFMVLLLILAWKGLYGNNNAYAGNSYFVKKAGDTFLGNNYFMKHHVIAGIMLALIVLLVIKRLRIENKTFISLMEPVYLFLAFLTLWVITLLPVMNNHALNEVASYTIHFNAVFHAVVQVYLGKALLVDLVHQYGLYPQFLEPIFRVVGLSVFNFTLVMGVLLGISMLAIYTFLKQAIRSRAVSFLGFSTFVFYTYFATKVGGWFDPYFQDQPIRIFFPFVIIFLAWRYFVSSKKFLYYTTFVVSTLAILWNVDTGLVVLSYTPKLCMTKG